jgi:excisionase family DNA binding protein
MRIAYSVNEACREGGFGRTTLYALLRDRKLKAHKLGKKTIILGEDLKACLESLPVADVSEAA